MLVLRMSHDCSTRTSDNLRPPVHTELFLSISFSCLTVADVSPLNRSCSLRHVPTSNYDRSIFDRGRLSLRYNHQFILGSVHDQVVLPSSLPLRVNPRLMWFLTTKHSESLLIPVIGFIYEKHYRSSRK